MKKSATSFVCLFAVCLLALINASPVMAAQISYGMPWPATGGQGATSGGTSRQSRQSVAIALSASCTALPLSARVGESVLWYSSVTGGAGGHQYFWSGSDGLTGNTSTVRRSYETPGAKTATVTVASGSQSVTIGCNAPVQVAPGTFPAYPSASFQSFGASCYAAEERIAPGESAAWLSVTTGLSPTATTTYKWEGSDGLTSDGPAAFKTYTLEGRKHALLTVTSGNQRTVAACTNIVTVARKVLARAPNPAPAPKPPSVPTAATTTTALLQGVCAPSLAEAKVNERVFWQATAIGGTGAYRFSWKGDNGLSGEGTTSAKAYDDTGIKRAAVVISSDKQTVEVNCAPSLEIKDNSDTGLLASSLFSGITSPFFTGLAVLVAGTLGFILARFRRSREEARETAPPHLTPLTPTAGGKQ